MKKAAILLAAVVLAGCDNPDPELQRLAAEFADAAYLCEKVQDALDCATARRLPFVDSTAPESVSVVDRLTLEWVLEEQQALTRAHQ